MAFSWSEIGSGCGDAGSTPPPKIARSTPQALMTLAQYGGSKQLIPRPRCPRSTKEGPGNNPDTKNFIFVSFVSLHKIKYFFE